MKFEEKLISLRKKTGLSQEELADRLGVSRQAISRWELGSTLPDAPNLLKLSDLFGVSIDYLLRDGEESEPTVSPERETAQSGKRPTNRRKFYLVACIMWLIAAVAFLMAAIDCMSIHLMLLVFIDAALSCIFLYKYIRYKE